MREPEVTPAIADLALLWRLTTGDPGICVAVLDGGVDLTHPCFDGADLTSIEGVSSAPTRHGTAVASLIFGQHGSAITGIAPRCRGLIVPVYSPTGSGDDEGLQATQIDLARAITTAVDRGAHVINISGGEVSSSSEPERFLADALRLCADRDVLVIGAAGNGGCDCVEIPAAVRSVLAVGASDGHGAPLAFSNWSETYRDHGVVFPGRDLMAATPDGGIAHVTGTSFATALVSGLAGLLLGVQQALGRRPSPHAIRAALLESVGPCGLARTNDCQRLLGGEVRVMHALARVLDPRTTEDIAMSAVVAQDNNGEGVRASGCGCGGACKGEGGCEGGCARGAATAKPESSLVYALAQIGYDFGTWTRYEWYAQQMLDRIDPKTGKPFGSPLHREAFILYLNTIREDQPGSWESFTWTLELDGVPIYALQPVGPYADKALERIKTFFHEQVLGREETAAPGAPPIDTVTFKSERCSVPGYLTGKSVTLLNGLVVPVIAITDRGLYNWSVDYLIHLAKPRSPISTQDAAETMLKQFFAKVYYQLRNLGRTPQERALNYSGTNVYELVEQIILTRPQDLETTMIQDIRVEKAPIGRPGSDCWDVTITVFNPKQVTEQARSVTRITIDVSDIVPVTVGPGVSWPEF